MPEGDTHDPALRALASRVSLILALVLAGVKFLAWLATGSVALLTSAMDALVDTGASLLTFLGVRYAQRPPDREHRFGHGKGEAIAGFTQATFLAGAALVLVVQSVQRLIFPEQLEHVWIGLGVICASLLAATGLVLMQTWVVRRTGSTAIAADRAHYLTDIAANAAVLAALGTTELTGWPRADPTFALAISGYMLWNAGGSRGTHSRSCSTANSRAGNGSASWMLSLPAKGARGIHDLRTRFSGDRTFVEYHLEVDGRLTVDRGHRVADVTEAAVERLLPGTVEATAHVEPLGIADQRLDEQVRRPSA